MRFAGLVAGKDIPKIVVVFFDPSTPRYSDEGVQYYEGMLVEGGTSRSRYDTFRCRKDHISSSGRRPVRFQTTIYWEWLTEGVHCGNDEWDSVPPFGGVGKTPKYYIVTVTGVRAVGCGGLAVNGEWLLEKKPGAKVCQWQRGNVEIEEGVAKYGPVRCCDQGYPANYWEELCSAESAIEVSLRSRFFIKYCSGLCNEEGYAVNVPCNYLFNANLNPCDIEGTYANERPNGGTVSYTPLTTSVTTWKTDEAYTAGVLKRHRGHVFRSLSGHISDSNSEPLAGDNWRTYWNQISYSAISASWSGTGFDWPIRPEFEDEYNRQGYSIFTGYGNTSCIDPSWAKFRVLAMEPPAGYEGEALEYKFFIQQEDEVLNRFDSDWQEGLSYETTGLNSEKNVSCHAVAKVKGYPDVKSLNSVCGSASRRNPDHDPVCVGVGYVADEGSYPLTLHWRWTLPANARWGSLIEGYKVKFGIKFYGDTEITDLGEWVDCCTGSVVTFDSPSFEPPDYMNAPYHWVQTACGGEIQTDWIGSKIYRSDC